MIEQVRAVVTDPSGQYRLVDLRPGVYSVTFQLTGFNTFKRDGIELPDAFIATINAELRIGSLEETITVTGETPIVDVQSIRRQNVVPGQTVRDLPVARTYGSLLQIDASVTATENKDVQMTPGRQFFGGAGGRSNEGRIEVDGLSVGPPTAGGGSSSYNADVGNAQEVTTTSTGGLGESAVGGPTVSIVPRSGGNTIQGTGFIANVAEWMVGNNLTQDLIDRGLAQPGDVEKLWDYTLGLGGPIVKNRLWFFTNLRDQGAYRKIPGMFANKNVGDPTKRTYEADLSRPARSAGSWTVASVRLTGQLTPRNRLGIFWDEQKPCHGGSFAPGIEACREPKDDYVLGGSVGSSSPVASATNAPEVASYSGGNYLRVQQATWSSTGLEPSPARGGIRHLPQPLGRRGNPGQPDARHRAGGGAVHRRLRGQRRHRGADVSVAELGDQHSEGVQLEGVGVVCHRPAQPEGRIPGRPSTTRPGIPAPTRTTCSIRVNNGIPNQLTQNMSGFYTTKNRVPTFGVYAQEQWTAGRVTFQGALRYDHASSFFPEQKLDREPLPANDVLLPRTVGVTGYDDMTPRGGVAWDLFGDGKTAVKINGGRYLQNAVAFELYTATNPLADIPVSVTRSWTDANNNFSPDCNLTNLEQSGSRSSGGDFCGTVSDLQLRHVESRAPGTTRTLLGGWGRATGRLAVRRLHPAGGAAAGFGRGRLYPPLAGELLGEDNLAVTPADFDTFSVTVPDDPRLPNAGETISGLYDVNSNKFGQADNYATLAENFGGQTQMYNGFLIERLRAADARPPPAVRDEPGQHALRHLRAPGGLAGNGPAESLLQLQHGSPDASHRVGGLLVPKVDVSVSSTFRSDQGEHLAANRAYTSAEVAPSLGRPLAGGTTERTVNLIEPGTMYGDRLNVFDMRFAKVLRFGRTRTNVGFDVYNILNSNPVITNNFTFVPGGTWLRPNSILAARFARFSATIDF